MTRIAAFCMAVGAAAIACIAAVASSPAATPSPEQPAVIVNSGSTNTAGFKLTIAGDGASTVVLQNRAGVAQNATRSFSVTAKQAATLFADLAAAKAAPAGPPGGCMKSASFGTSTHVSWQGWTSPDLDCPSDVAAITALKNDVTAIRAAAGVGEAQLLHRQGTNGPLHVTSPPPKK